ncbi:MAG: hypothetical protein KDI45_16870 [Candidatus Accumulibacter sp.]|nr:hypothetical protein [Accumulibacter sp.]
MAHRARLLQEGQRALSLADGQGRNSVWLAEQGLEAIHQDSRLLIADESD